MIGKLVVDNQLALIIIDNKLSNQTDIGDSEMAYKSERMNEIKKQTEAITGLRVSVRDCGKFYTVCNKQSDLGNGFGFFVSELKKEFGVSFLDGGSFQVKK